MPVYLQVLGNRKTKFPEIHLVIKTTAKNERCFGLIVSHFQEPVLEKKNCIYNIYNHKRWEFEN